MSMSDYWCDAIGDSLEQMGAFSALTPEQIRALAKDVEVSVENRSLADGSDAIPNPMIHELKEVKRAHKAEVEYIESVTDKTERGLRREIEDLGYTINRLCSELQEAREAR